jgi:dihydrolipoamide dehydrogenase
MTRHDDGDSAAGADTHTQLLVIGGGPGGYTAAFRAADLGFDVTLIERHATLGGVCLNVGCIPSKALLHAVGVIADAEQAAECGISFAAPAIDFDRLRNWKDGVVTRLTTGLAGLASQRGVTVVRGSARLTGPDSLECEGRRITFEHAILATGSRPARLDGIPYEDPRVMSSTDALMLREVPARLLVLGGGIIGLELATVYDALGSRVTVVELADQLISECDRDLVALLQQRISARYEAIHLGTQVSRLDASEDGLRATLARVGTPLDAAVGSEPFDAVLVAVGRTANTDGLGLDSAGVKLNSQGFVVVDSQLRTSCPRIHAVGDLIGGPMLAHKATHEAKLAAEIIAGHDVELDVRGIPSVAYTVPELAWVGLTEKQANGSGRRFQSVTFPWSASGRALASSAAGFTKLLFDPDTNRLLGAGIVGANAGELISEPALALELEVDTEDIAMTVHAHPTLAETVKLAAEMAEGTVTDLPAIRHTAIAT